jgi:hypothetical protein
VHIEFEQNVTNKVQIFHEQQQLRRLIECIRTNTAGAPCSLHFAHSKQKKMDKHPTPDGIINTSNIPIKPQNETFINIIEAIPIRHLFSSLNIQMLTLAKDFAITSGRIATVRNKFIRFLYLVALERNLSITYSHLKIARIQSFLATFSHLN